MKFWKLLGIGIVSLCVLFGLHQGVDTLMKAHNWKGLGASDWAAWVQAVGSVVAILVAVWISNRDKLTARSDAYTLALVASAEMAGPARSAFRQILELHYDFGKAAQHPHAAEAHLEYARDVLTKLPRFSNEQIAAVLPLPSGCARRLARAQLNLQVFLSDWTPFSEHPDHDAVKAFCQIAKVNIERISDDYQSVIFTLMNHGMKPPTEPREQGYRW